jgi:hypothetical protein
MGGESRDQPLLDESHAAFIQSGVSIIASSCDRANVPALAKAVGCRVSPDRRRVIVLLAASQAAPVLEDIAITASIAVVFSKPTTHQTIQLKGTDAALVPVEPTDRACLERYAAAYAAELSRLGWGVDTGRVLVWCEPAELVAVAFTPAAAFNQTPGPRAGASLTG